MDKILTPAELKFLQEFAEDVLFLSKLDDGGVMDNLGELAETALEILGKPKNIRYENEPDEL